METVLVGKFQNGIMLQASPAKIVAERCNDGIKEIILSKPKPNTTTFKYNRATRLYIGHQPTEMDPYEKKNVYIKELKWGGDSLFAKRDIEKNDLVSYYGGILWNETELRLFPQNNTSYNW